MRRWEEGERNNMRSFFILSLCSLFLVQYFIKYESIQTILMVMAFLAFIVSTPNSRIFPCVMSYFMMGFGMFLELQKGNGVDEISHGLLLILPLICLITLTPLLSIPLRMGGYFQSVEAFLRNLVQHPKRLFLGITTTLFILSPILSLGSVRIINDFLQDLKLPSFMYAKSYLIGYSTAVLWSPFFASVSLVLLYLNIPVRHYIFYGIGLSLMSLVVGGTLFVLWERRYPLDRNAYPQLHITKKQQRQLVQLAVFIVLLLLFSITIEYITKWSMIVIVCLISVIVPIIWGLSKGWKEFHVKFCRYRTVTVPMMNNEIMIFTSAGLFAHAVQGTRFANSLSDFLTHLSNQSVLLFAIAVMIIVLTTTYLGLHQIAVVAALAMQLNPQALGISTISLAVLLLLTWSISTALSPFSGLNIMVSKLIGLSGVKVGLRANGLHLSILAIMGICIMMFIK